MTMTLHCCVHICLRVLDNSLPNVERSSVGASDQPRDCQTCNQLLDEVSTSWLFICRASSCLSLM